MSRPLAVAALAVLALTGPVAAAAQPAPSIVTRLAPSSITIGDRVEVTVEMATDDPELLRLARLSVPQGHWGKAEILTPASLAEAGIAGRAPRRWSFTITAFETGRLELPPLEVRVGDDPERVLRAPDSPVLEVRSVLSGEEASPAPAPPAPPRPLSLPAAFWWSAGALAAGLLAATLALARRRSPAGSAVAAAPPPFAELEIALAGLGNAAAEAEYARLSSAVRRFLGRRCGFPALESTTTEITRRLVANRIDPALARQFRELLAACDGIKFARRPATEQGLLAVRDGALDLARRVESARTPPAERSS